MDYREAGVDVEAGRAFVDQIRQMVNGTHRPGVLGGLGGFGGLFELPMGYQAPVLVSGTDGVGTKLKVAQALNRHDSVGIDLVAMCANDVLTSGAEPLFFLDYLATGKLDADQLAAVVEGIAAGLASRGIHSNGYSLVRKIMAEASRSDRATPGYNWDECPPELNGQSLADALLTPTPLYVRPVLAARQQGLEIHAMAHITGGGLPENLPRCLSDQHTIALQPMSWPPLPIFQWLVKAGQVSTVDMFETFNMGIGFVVIVPAAMAEQAIAHFQAHGVDAYAIGQVIDGDGTLTGIPTR